MSDMRPAQGATGAYKAPLEEDLPRLASTSRALLEQRPDLKNIPRHALAELTLQQIVRDNLDIGVLSSFSPACRRFREILSIIPDQAAQRVLGAKEISYNPSNALPAALAGLSLSPGCRAIAAEQLLALTDEASREFSVQIARFLSVSLCNR
jgi:hypothetical protein